MKLSFKHIRHDETPAIIGYPMFVVDTTRKARKDHRCIACRVKIPKGFDYVVSACAYDGRMSSSKWHTECRERFSEMLRYLGDEEGDPDLTWEDGMPEELKKKYGVENDRLQNNR